MTTFAHQRFRRSLDNDIQVAYSDEHVIIFVKPQGLATIDKGSVSLLKSDALLLEPEVSKPKYRKAIPVHRLDKSTGGLVVCSKSIECERILKQSFRERTVTKRYCAIVRGRMVESKGTISIPISGAPSVTEFEVIQCTPSGPYDWITTVNLWPTTGRQHQLRRHMKYIGHPILGDERYWDKSPPLLAYSQDIPSPFQQCYLWALEVKLSHPMKENETINVVLDEPPIYEEMRRIQSSLLALSSFTYPEDVLVRCHRETRVERQEGGEKIEEVKRDYRIDGMEERDKIPQQTEEGVAGVGGGEVT
jgi:23S rRNA-/tRNA-specific pseudouridylate synthase